MSPVAMVLWPFGSIRSSLERKLSPKTRRYFTMSMAHVTNILMGIEYGKRPIVSSFDKSCCAVNEVHI
jgi:hypothetical protein